MSTLFSYLFEENIVIDCFNIFQTPINRPPPVSSVTPKVNMSEPMSVLRRPNQGEIALSMTGSPLMVSSVARDDMATISVPLANGNVSKIIMYPKYFSYQKKSLLKKKKWSIFF